MNENEQNTNHLQWLDYLVFITMLLISLCIGVYHRMTGGRQKTTAEYLLADKSMGVLPVSFSLMASFMSAITLLGVSAEVYFYGAQFILINISYIIGSPIAAYVFLPIFYKLKLTSVYEYLELRFNRSIRILVSVIFILQMIFYNAIVLYAPALALSAVTGVNRWTSIFSVGIVCTIYCTIGGMKAVLWTDVFQSFLMFFSMVTIIIKGTIDVGGWNVVFERAMNGSRLEFNNFNPDFTERHTVWGLVFGSIFIYISIYGVNQAQIQRLMTVKNLQKSQQALFISLPLTSMISLVTALTGLVMYANFYQEDPLKCGYIKKPDQLLPYYAVNRLSEYPGLPGFIIAGIFSGSLSTVSSFVNSLSAVTLEDYLKPVFKRDEIFTKNEVIITKLLALFYGILCVMLTILADQMTGLLQASLTLFGVVGGPLLMIFTAGICFRSINSNGAATGFIVSLIFGLWIGFGSMLFGKRPERLPLSTELCSDSQLGNSTTIPYFKPKNIPYEPSTLFFYNISYLWSAGFCWVLGLIVAIVVSWWTKDSSIDDDNKERKQIQQSLLHPLVRRRPNIDQLSCQPIMNDIRMSTIEKKSLPNVEHVPNGIMY
ncbi:hypothetical protein DERP_014423 [Dermatophagoides pteronyssinus]|uniref:Uncharacterized protein n=2 Tax=Dermatophagoides pteronyssinus TaxID=6956 RepID=A0ABQ8IW30_DERPT|nr:putative sodium-dependent multivitamin transporter [Dermatophagoides pteronyssinus]KAH9414402.1 hypothetical protein DERP_014423 [Dermatophagoides pteronyssinus]